MKKILGIALILVWASTQLYAQKTQGPFTIWVYNIASGCTQGSLITSNSQLQPNTTYIVRVRSINSPAAIWVDNVDGFEMGWIGQCPFAPLPNSSSFAADTGSFNNWTISFQIRTSASPDFSSPVFMRVRRTFNGTSWVDIQRITFPY